MRMICLFLALGLSACNVKDTGTGSDSDSLESRVDSVSGVNDENKDNPLPPVKSYSNVRFKDVTVEKVGPNRFTIEGKGQIFEASFSWVVEDGHEELQQGFQMTDAGAPEWGKFKFTIEAQKKRTNSTLTLILFESSPKDGSRQHELPIVLE
ncbi:MAG: Gmad2 immunoglobulin-like domain-containing protein [Cyclobacteriaceae bacterium]